MKDFEVAVLIVIFTLCAVPVIGTNGVCKNNGRPLSGNYRKCRCAFGYKGYNCGVKVSPCEVRPCRNNGRCIESYGGTFICKCLKSFEGILCEKKVLPCDRKPCKNGGKCTNTGTEDGCFKCTCLKGFKGPDCSRKVSPCEASPCQNGGVCTNVNGGFKCTCKDGYGGMVCDKKDAIHSSFILDGHPKWVKQLKVWLPAKRGLQLCYRASRHGFTSQTFHSLCDHRGPTVTLVRAGYYIFGGFTDQPWGGSSRYIRSTNSFLFSFRNKYNLRPFKAPVYRNHNNAIYTNPGYGPTFGGGHDLYIRSDGNTKTGSYTNFGHTYRPPSGYGYGTSNTKALLAGNYNFQPSEIEVFYYHD